VDPGSLASPARPLSRARKTSFWQAGPARQNPPVLFHSSSTAPDRLYDKYYAIKHRSKSTGNGRRQSYSHRPFPRMTNTLIMPGKSNADEIIKGFKKGILVNKMGGGQVNTLTGDFIFDVQEGYLIENGEIVHPLKQVSIIGNGPKVLSEVEAVCNDFGVSLGTCGKEGQGVPVGDGQPTILIPNITIGGTSF
jgi:TldD protein